ncbi:MAG: DUF2235 domain-containing protein, partial [Planctomycetia bacterium]|nr:DUF2235 domain-containing protein [Planctomycetia bacterium]
ADVTDDQTSAALNATLQSALATASRRHEIDIATAAKQHAIDWATAEKQYQLDLVNKVETAAKDVEKDRADVEKDRDVAEAGIDLAARQTASTAEEVYAVGTSLAQRDRSLALAAIDQVFALGAATQRQTKTNADAAADVVSWNATTAAENTHRAAIAWTDSAYWLAEYNDTVTATADMDAWLASPWSAYLADWAVAQYDWWADVAGDYLTWIGNRNVAETNYQNSLSTAHTTKITTRAATDYTYASTLAGQRQTTTNAQANALHAKHTSLAGVTTTYASDVGQAEHDYQVDVAAARRVLAYSNKDYTAYDTYYDSLQQAEDDRKDALKQSEQDYSSGAAAALAAQIAADATAEYDLATATATASWTRTASLNASEASFRQTESNAYLTITTAESWLDKAYWDFEAFTIAAYLSSMASSNGSPWAAYDAAEAAAYSTWVTGMAAAVATWEVAQATAQRNFEVTQAATDQANRDAIATANANFSTSVAAADLASANSESAGIAALGSSGGYRADLPSVPVPEDVSSRYVIGAASSADYYVKATYVNTTYAGCWSYGFGGFGGYGCGWGGFGYGYGFGWDWGYGGFGYGGFGYDYGFGGYGFGGGFGGDGYGYGFGGGFGGLGGYGDGYVALSTPPVLNVESGFWDLQQDIIDVEQVKNVGSFDYEQADGNPTPLPQLAPITVAAPSEPFDPQQVAEALDALNGYAAQAWKAYTWGTQFVMPARGEPTSSSSSSGVSAEPDSKVEDGKTPAKAAESQSVQANQGASSAQLADEAFYAQLTDASDDKPHGQGVIYAKDNKVYWNATQSAHNGPRLVGDAVLLGTRGEFGWVYLDAKYGGGRATLTSLGKAFKQFPNVSIQGVLDGVRSPYRINANSNEIGIFIGGTSMHMLGIGNVERMYNLYQGTKFYYGGIGNPIDSNWEMVNGSSGGGWTTILDRAEADILSRIPSNPSAEIHIFGWSRGAAQSVELARRLGTKGIRVKFLGLFDPVYSKGLASPGQDSQYVKSTGDGRDGNYVTGSISGNVDVATVIYAMNESRNWFPATKFTTTGRTQLFNIASPGGHGEVGGHWGSNMNVQQLNLRAMIEYARGKGGATLRYRGLDTELQAIFASQFTRELVWSDIDVDERDAKFGDWEEAQKLEHWSPYAKEEFKLMASNRNERFWWPGAFGAQQRDALNEAKYVPIAGGSVLLGPLGAIGGAIKSRNQPWTGHDKRILSWVNIGLYDIYPGIDSVFIKSLYERQIDGVTGGWDGMRRTW